MKNSSFFLNFIIAFNFFIFISLTDLFATKRTEKEPVYKNYQLLITDTIFIKGNTESYKLLNLTKYSPDGCLSYYSDSNNFIVDCGYIIQKFNIIDPDQSRVLLNFNWIDYHRVLFTFSPSSSAGIHDFAIFIYNVKTGTQEMNFEFEGSGLIHLTMPDLKLAYTNSTNYDMVNTEYFNPIFNEEDSSLILPVMPAYNKIYHKNDFHQAAKHNTEVLLKVYAKGTGKFAERLNLKLSTLREDCFDNLHLPAANYLLCGIYDKVNKRYLLSTAFSNEITAYNTVDNYSNKLTKNVPFIHSCIGSDTMIKNSGKEEFFTFGQLIHHPMENKYYRVVEFPKEFKDGKYINFKYYGLIVMDSLFNTDGFVYLPKGYQFADITPEGFFLLYHYLEENKRGTHRFILCKSGNYELKTGYVEVPSGYVFE